MGTANWQPKWWTKEQHESNWDRVKEAMKRDWEQTKNDFHAGGRDLDQDVDDTVKQAAGRQAIPSRNQPNAASDGSSKSNLQWSDVEAPTRYGYGARQQYGAQHADWDDKLEARLKTEWEETADSGQRWEEAKAHVRRGYERARS